MTAERLLFADIRESEPEANRPLWSSSDNSFRFNFFSAVSAPPAQEETFPAARAQDPPASLSFPGHSSRFAFDFQIPAAAEDVDTAQTRDSSPEDGASRPPGATSGCDGSERAKTKKKKKKSGQKKEPDTETRQKPTEGSQKDEELSSEEQWRRQLDWCVEQLELGLKSQKGTPKQKEEASRALKTLRSSKAPLVKKRQVMRAMTGDYRTKMEEERSRQFRLIQSETASAHVKVASESPKKSVFHRRAEARSRPREPEGGPRGAATQEETAAFSFQPSKEEFHFNFF